MARSLWRTCAESGIGEWQAHLFVCPFVASVAWERNTCWRCYKQSAPQRAAKRFSSVRARSRRWTRCQRFFAANRGVKDHVLLRVSLAFPCQRHFCNATPNVLLPPQSLVPCSLDRWRFMLHPSKGLTHPEFADCSEPGVRNWWSHGRGRFRRHPGRAAFSTKLRS